MMNIRRLLPSGLALVLLYVSASAVCASEIQLAGIRLGSSALTVMQKYGNPSRIQIGATTTVETVSTVAPPAMAPSSPGTMRPASPFAPSAPGTMPGFAPRPGGPSASSTPAGPSMRPPSESGAMGDAMSNLGNALGSGLSALFGGASSSGSPSFGGGTQVMQTKTASEVIWTYEFAKNRTLEFIISPDGKVRQIQVFGTEWSGVGTSKGIHLGHTYKDIIMKYGFPESHQKEGITLTVKYPSRDRVVFTLVGKTLVGITIGLMD